jgi:hypothetical protein
MLSVVAPKKFHIELLPWVTGKISCNVYPWQALQASQMFTEMFVPQLCLVYGRVACLCR